MLPFGPFFAVAGEEVSPPANWTVSRDGGVSTANRANRSWSGREDDGNGFSSLLLPFAAVPGATYRLAFTASAAGIGYGVGAVNSGALKTTQAGSVEYILVMPNIALQQAFLATSSTAIVSASDIIFERLN